PYQVYYGYVDTAQHVEIADVAQGVIGLYHGYWVQGIWSNRAYAATGDGRVLPPRTRYAIRTGRPDGIVNPNPRYTAFEEDDDLVAPSRPVPASAGGVYSTTQDTSLEVRDLLAGATHPTGNPLSLVIETAPTHG